MKKTALITGASRGIGRETATKLATMGYNVIINYYQSEEMAFSLSESLNNQGHCTLPIQADVSDRTQVEKMFATIESSFGGVDLLINNAGIAEMKLFTDITEDYWNRIFAVNVNGMFHCTQLAVPYMISIKSGKIINLSSIWGIVGASCETHYSATKGAGIAFTKSLAKELGPSNIQVNAIAPGAVYTDMISGLGPDILNQVVQETPLGRLGNVQDIASTIGFLASKESDFITGQIISPNGGLVIT